jgi:hypothetical protein
VYITIYPEADLKELNKTEAAKRALYGTQIKIKSKEQFLELITMHTWSPGIFKDNQRMNKNFIKTYFMAFDIDENLSLKEAIERLKCLGYTCIIGTSFNHQKEKDGVIADRYRIIFPLRSPVLTPLQYKATWISLAGSSDTALYNADQSCKDPARFFFPCEKAAIMTGYRKLEKVAQQSEPKKEIMKKKYDGGKKGKLSSRTLKFLEEGAAPGQRHYEFILSVMDMKAQGYTKDEVKDVLIPFMKEIKPEENANWQINYIFDKYGVEFEYREEKK